MLWDIAFKHEVKHVGNYQGNVVVNYISADVPFTRVIEHKWLKHGRGDSNKTVVTHEYPQKWNRNRDPYNRKDRVLYSKYVELSYQRAHNVIFGGWLGQHHYYNMDRTIMAALELVQ